METKTPRHGVEQIRVLDGNGDDVRDVELEEEDVVEDRVDVSIADKHEDQEGNRDEVADAGESGRKSPRAHDFCFYIYKGKTKEQDQKKANEEEAEEWDEREGGACNTRVLFLGRGRLCIKETETKRSTRKKKRWGEKDNEKRNEMN